MVSIRPYFPSLPLECLGMRLACVLSGCTYSHTVHIHSYMYHSVLGNRPWALLNIAHDFGPHGHLQCIPKIKKFIFMFV